MKFPIITAAFASAFLASPAVMASQLKWDNRYSYSTNLPLTSFACSDGSNGLITKYKGAVQNVAQLRAKLKPNVYVAAHKFVTGWNSPYCGSCFRARSPKTNRWFNFVAIDVARDGIETVIAGADAFSTVSPSGSTAEGIIDVYITYYKQSPSECFR